MSGGGGVELLIGALSAAFGFSLTAGGDVYENSLVYGGVAPVIQQEHLGWLMLAAAAIIGICWLSGQASWRIFALLGQQFLWLFLFVLFVRSGVPSVWPPFCLVLCGACDLSMLHLAWHEYSSLPSFELQIIFRWLRRS
jgi:hypothetical protein